MPTSSDRATGSTYDDHDPLRPLQGVEFEYVPYHLLDGCPNVVVDGSPADGTLLTLSHWPNSPCPPGLEADLSAQMAFAFMDRLGSDDTDSAMPSLDGNVMAVSNNHFDQDGLVSLFALIHPEEANSRREELVGLARAGDFARYSKRDIARASMVISAFADPGRSPLGSDSGDYPQWTSRLYEELLPRLTHVCEHVGEYSDMWEEEDATLEASEKAITSGRVLIEEDPELDLAVIHVPRDAPTAGGHIFAGSWRTGLHPMALNNATGMFALAVLTGNRYELIYRYESWVQYRSARPRARVDLSPLAAELDQLETGDASWAADKVSAISPVLRLHEGTSGPESGISPDRFVEAVRAHLRSASPAWDPYAIWAGAGSPA